MYTFMFCFLISDDVMLPHRTVLFSSFSAVHVFILYEKKKARSLENITSSELGKTSKLRRSVILFYQYDRRDVMRKRSITRGIPSRRVLMGVPNSQLTTIFSAKYQLTTIFLANSQLTTNFG